MTIDEIKGMVDDMSNTEEHAERRLKYVDIIKALDTYKDERDGTEAVKDTEIGDRDEVIRLRDERIRQLEDSNRRIVEEYGRAILKEDRRDDEEKEIEERKEEINIEELFR